MAETKMRLKVMKSDGVVENYLHTKVIGTINTVLSGTGESDIQVAEHLAEVVTYHLYNKQRKRTVTSSEIFSIIKVVLSSTGYESAAIALSEYHFERRLKRSRIEVVPVDVQELADAELICGSDQGNWRARWDKSRVVSDLVEKYGMDRQTARAVASMVEEKIFSMGLTYVSASLVKQLVLSDAATMLNAERQLQMV